MFTIVSVLLLIFFITISVICGLGLIYNVMSNYYHHKGEYYKADDMVIGKIYRKIWGLL